MNTRIAFPLFLLLCQMWLAVAYLATGFWSAGAFMMAAIWTVALWGSYTSKEVL